MDQPIAANVLGTLGAVCWSVQLLPQIWKNWRRHDNEGLPALMFLLWSIAGIPLGVYNIVEDFNIALQIQPNILTFLSIVTWAQCKYYGDKWSLKRICVVAVPLATLLAGIEVGLVFALRVARRNHQQWALYLVAILSAVLLALGVLRHYLDIYRTKTVRGISLRFVVLDAMGDLVSILSILFQESYDVLGFVIYGSELALWIGILVLALISRTRGSLKRSDSSEVSDGQEDDHVKTTPISHAV